MQSKVKSRRFTALFQSLDRLMDNASAPNQAGLAVDARVSKAIPLDADRQCMESVFIESDHDHKKGLFLFKGLMSSRFIITSCAMLLLTCVAAAQTENSSDMVGNAVIPLLSQLGFGGVVGFLVGFTLKKVSKLVAIALGLIFILLQVLAYYGIVVIQWGPVASWWSQVAEPQKLQGLWTTLRDLLFTNVPALAGAVPGFLLGLKKG
jgi:uncharacterized membrane protein (Fun14 family)